MLRIASLNCSSSSEGICFTTSLVRVSTIFITTSLVSVSENSRFLSAPATASSGAGGASLLDPLDGAGVSFGAVGAGSSAPPVFKAVLPASDKETVSCSATGGLAGGLAGAVSPADARVLVILTSDPFTGLMASLSILSSTRKNFDNWAKNRSLCPD